MMKKDLHNKKFFFPKIQKLFASPLFKKSCDVDLAASQRFNSHTESP